MHQQHSAGNMLCFAMKRDCISQLLTGTVGHIVHDHRLQAVQNTGRVAAVSKDHGVMPAASYHRSTTQRLSLAGNGMQESLAGQALQEHGQVLSSMHHRCTQLITSTVQLATCAAAGPMHSSQKRFAGKQPRALCSMHIRCTALITSTVPHAPLLASRTAANHDLQDIAS
jgi:hypothetical protein